MPHRVARAAILLVLSAWSAAAIFAWTDATRTRMLEDARKVSPPALGLILERHEKELANGMLEPSRHESEEVHFQHADDGRGLAAEAIAQKEDEIRALLREHRSLRRFAYEIGVLSHLVADVDFPLNASDSDPREPLYREAYRSYIESNLERIPFVLDREPSPELDAGDVRGFIRANARRALKNYPLIGPAFKDDGTPRSPDAVDERSVPFGIASLSYSNAVSDIVRVWIQLWGSLNGDLRDTPYLNLPPPEKVKLPARPPKKKGSAGRPEAAPAGSAVPAPSAAPTPSPSPTPAATGSPTPGGGA